jgi:plasmid stabilization system protein ParE
MLTIETSPKATKDIKKAMDWYEEKSDGLGERLLKTINRKVKRIATRPDESMFISHLVQRAILKKFPYQIFFTRQENTIIILRVRHTKQKPLRRFK